MKQRPKMRNALDGSYSGIRYATGKQSDDSEEEVELLHRNGKHLEHFLEVQVQHGDTLQAIALRFNCPIAKLMRVNHLIRENEIFAKRVLKVPVSAYSLLTESLPQVHKSGTNSPTASKLNISQVLPAEDEKDLQQRLIIASVNSTQIEVLPKVEPSASAGLMFQRDDEDATVEMPLIADSANGNSSIEAVVVNEFNSKGADLGLKWIHLLLCVLILGVLIPIIYVVYIAEHPEKYHHSQ